MAYEREMGTLREFGRLTRGMRWVLPQLEEEERRVLEMMLIVPNRGNLGALCQEFACEKTTVYRRRDLALEHFTKLWLAWESGKVGGKLSAGGSGRI